MENLNARSYAPGLNRFNIDSDISDSAVIPTAERFSESLPEAISANIPPETQELINREITRQLRQIEPVYKVIHSLRQEVSKVLLRGVHLYQPQDFGFNISQGDDVNISPLIKKLELASKCLNAIYEDMQGMASDLTVAVRRMSLNLQTQLTAVILRFKEYSKGGEIDRSSHADYLSDLENLQMLLGNDEINLETLRGRIGN